MAHLKNEKNIFKQAADKFHKVLKIEPNDYSAINALGTIELQLENISKALTYFEQSFQLVKQAGDKKFEEITTANILQACTDLIVQEIKSQNLGQVKKIFKKFLLHKSSIKKEDWHNSLLRLFNGFLAKDNVNIYFELEKILREQKAEDELKLLYPISKVYEYWQSNEDAEVLDRLNPEVREVVEDILKNVESKKNK